ncbi:MAG: class I SAM-dependent methyltransferase [Eubacteriales bacterium]
MLITTSDSKNEEITKKAHLLAEKYGLTFRARAGRSIKYLMQDDKRIFVVNNLHGLSYYEDGKDELFYHPNMAFHRIYQLKHGGSDTLAEVCRIDDGTTFFDGTMGLAADALTISFLVGERGSVTAAEKSLPIYILVNEGLKSLAEKMPSLKPAVSRMEIHNADCLDMLKNAENGAYDVVYFDFMFGEPNFKSVGLNTMRSYACPDRITEEHVSEAVRCAKKRVIIKTDPASAELLEKCGLRQIKKSSRGAFCYMGMIK